MKNAVRWMVPGLVMAGLGAGLFWSVRKKPALERAVIVSFELQNRSGRVSEGTTVKVHAPLAETASQESEIEKVSHDYVAEEDKAGNRTLTVSLGTVPQHDIKVVQVRTRVRTADAASWGDVPPRREEREPGPFVESNAAAVESVAKSLFKGDSLESAKAMVGWVAQNVRLDAGMREPRGAVAALEKKAGSSFDRACAVAALARAVGMPARIAAGVRQPGNGAVAPGGFVFWTEIFADGAWRVADPGTAGLDAERAAYVTMMRPVLEPGLAVLPSLIEAPEGFVVRGGI